MADPNSKADLAERVNDLLVNPDVIERIDIIDSDGKVQYGIPNSPTTQKSLQIYAYITNNESMLTSEGAKTGLAKYGEELVIEAELNKGKHPSIDFLSDIVEKNQTFHSHVVTPYSAKPIPEHVRKALPRIAKEIGTPVHVYDVQGIQDSCRRFNNAFLWVPGGFRNFFAVKACPNPVLMEIMKAEGFGADCSSAPELTLANAVGMRGEDIMFTSNDTPDSEFQYARRLGAIENLDDITHIAAVERATGRLPDLISFRYAGEECQGNSIIGGSAERKYGLTREQIFDAYRIAKDKGVKRFMLHTMMASNERNVKKLIEQARIMFKLNQDIKIHTGVDNEGINFGGGIGTSYKPWDKDVSLEELGTGIKELYFQMRMIGPDGKVSPTKLFFECGRMPTGPNGLLLKSVRHVMQKLRTYVGVDATMADLMRPGMYGAYHHEVVVGKESEPHNTICDVVGSLCENCDKFAVQRFLPVIARDDLLATLNAGAHGRAMCFNYNAKLRSGEVAVWPDSSFDIIRRPETEKDYLATLDFPGSKYKRLAR